MRAEILKLRRMAYVANAMKIRLAAQDAARAARDAGYSEFYVEVKQALMAEGKAEHVAASLIDTEQKLNAQARRLRI